MISFRNTIFNLFGSYDRQVDINKDADGKGTYERYNEVIGKYIDEELLPYIDNLVDNNLLPDVAYDRFIPYLEADYGVTLFLYDSIEWRRRVLRNILKWYDIKGTVRAYKLMIAMLGFDTEITIEEFLKSSSFDSPITFDDPERVFDTAKCNACIYYSIHLAGDLVITPELVKALEAVIKFNEPINALLQGVYYNGEPIVYEIITIYVDANGDLIYNNEYDESLVITLSSTGDMIIGGPNAHRYTLNSNGDLIYIL